MQSLPEKEILRLIRRQQPFAATCSSGAFSVRIDRYVPAVCTAIHSGHEVSPGIEAKMGLSREERRREEDPYTGEMLDSFPIAMVGLHSRYQYDLNRPPEDCIYNEAWGKEVWRKPLGDRQRRDSLALHAGYYRVLHDLIIVLEREYGRCVIYDLHSYNGTRAGNNAPLFNIGTHHIDTSTFQPVLKHLAGRLRRTSLPNVETRIAFDEVFQGRGYQAAYIREHHPASLCIPLEIKKVYMDEVTGDPFPLALEALKETLKQAISYNGAYFSRKHTGKRVRRARFFSEEREQVIRKVDAALYRAARGIDTLRYINPLNLIQERKTFFASQGNYTPNFRYRQLRIDPYGFREKLYAIPVDRIQDVSIRQLYRSTVDMLAVKIDLLTSVGTEHFLYNSLRFHGEPRKKDIELARFFLAAPPLAEEREEETFTAEECATRFREAIDGYGFDCRVELSGRIVARAMVSSGRRRVLLNRRSRFTATEILALIHHELGVHMVTTINAGQSPLKIFKLGLPGNTQTQEGLALLSEYLSGNLTLSRLKTLAHRVMAVHMMVQNYDFSRTFKALTDDFGLSGEDAFTLTVRVFRGGGFTKDYLYLTGLRQALRMYRSGADMRSLFVGKTTFFFHDTIKEMIERSLIERPAYLPASWGMATDSDPILDYLLKAVT